MSTGDTKTCQCCEGPLGLRNRKKCDKCRKIVCKKCVNSHPQVLLPALGMKIKQTICPKCFPLICSKSSPFIVRDDKGRMYSTGEHIPDGLLTLSAEDEKVLEEPITELQIQPTFLSTEEINQLALPHLRIIFILVGSRGDVQVSSKSFCFVLY